MDCKNLLQSVANAYYTTQQVSVANSRITDAESRLDAADTKFTNLNTAVAAVQTSASSGSATCTQVNFLYFLGFCRVVTLISLLTALKETCSPNSLRIYCKQGYIPQECNSSKAANKFL